MKMAAAFLLVLTLLFVDPAFCASGASFAVPRRKDWNR
jgi:hypothetical protein